jgi:transcriptional regulator with XRE-family HTH domain
MAFNFKIILEIQRRDSIRRAELASMLGISDNHLYRIERGIRQPSLELVHQISKVMKVSVDRLLEDQDETADGSLEGARPSLKTNFELDPDLDEFTPVEKRNLELERDVRHLTAIISLHTRFENIVCDNSLSKAETRKRLEALAKDAAMENEASFKEIRDVLRVKRATVRTWVRSVKGAYRCFFAEGGEILASTPGEAALRLRCFDCKSFESGECGGHGNEKRPNNIIELVIRLDANCVSRRGEQARIIDKSYHTPISQHELSEVIYRYNRGLPISEGIFYLDGRGRKK